MADVIGSSPCVSVERVPSAKKALAVRCLYEVNESDHHDPRYGIQSVRIKGQLLVFLTAHVSLSDPPKMTIKRIWSPTGNASTHGRFLYNVDAPNVCSTNRILKRNSYHNQTKVVGYVRAVIP